ncbi:unnamed protein product [Schistosoma turkestanicum]|nr:unnamed protein product [Schistosoma turkestanicum]
MKLIAAIFLIIFLLFGNNSEHVCQLPKLEEPSFGVYSGSINKRYLGPQRLKITTYYDKTVINSYAAEKIVTAIESSSRYWEKALIVKTSAKQNLFVERECEEEKPKVSNSYERIPHCSQVHCKHDVLCSGLPVPDKYIKGFANSLFSLFEDISQNIDVTKDYQSREVKALTLPHMISTIKLFFRGLDIAPFCEKKSEKICSRSANEYQACIHDKSFRFADTTKYPGSDDDCFVLSFMIAINENFNCRRCKMFINNKCVYYVAENSKTNPYYEEFGYDSACFHHVSTSVFTMNEPEGTHYEPKAACHKIRCSLENGLEVKLFEDYFPCPVNGGNKIIQLHYDGNNFLNTTIDCPPCPSLCKKFGVYSGVINKRYVGRQNLKITVYYDRALVNSIAFSKVMGCYHRKYAETWQEYYDGEGVAPNELILLVKHNVSDECHQGAFAWATYCSLDPASQRPFIGAVNFCASEKELIQTENEEMETTAKHEIAHVLVG